jgi:hypothetical protein
MVPINVSPEKLQHLVATFQCQAGALPFTYMGLSLCLNQPSVQECWPRIEVRLTNTSIWLTQGGKLEMVNSVLSSICVLLRYRKESEASGQIQKALPMEGWGHAKQKGPLGSTKNGD